MRRPESLLLLALLASPLACGGPAPAPPSSSPPVAPLPAAASVARLPAEPIPRGPLPHDAYPTHQRLGLDLDPEADRFRGVTSIDLTFDKPRDVLWLHGRGLTIASVALTLERGETLRATWAEVDPSGVARVTLPRAASGNATLVIQYDAPYDDNLVGVYRTPVAHDGTHAVFSKFEAIYARRAFPCFDEPSFKVPFDLQLTVPKEAVALANMPVISTTELGDSRVVTFATTPPLPTYLVAFAVGPFASNATAVPAAEGRVGPLPLDVIAVHGHEFGAAFALAESPALVAEEERYYGVPFPYPKLDLLAVPDFQSGAMENAGLITFRDSSLLVDERSATLGQRMRVDETIAHEVAHQWFGDLVTMRWWDDLWLNESFASFLGTRALRAVKPALENELVATQSTNDVLDSDGLASTRRIRQPIASTDDITNAFDGITYAKGEAILAMVERYLGDEAFRSALHEYLSAHAGGNATTADLVAALSTASHKDLAPLFASFLDQPGAPLIAAKATCEHGKGSIALAQSRWLPFGSGATKDESWTVPVCARAGVGGKVVDACALLGAAEGTIALPGCADWIMPNADGRGYYRFTLDGGDLAHLRDKGTKLLTTVERVALAGDLDAAFHSASLRASDVLHALEPLARDPHGAVAETPLALYRFVADSVLDEASRPRFRAYVRAIYTPAIRSLGWKPAANESTWASLERTDLLTFAAKRLDDKSVLDEGARLGRAYLGLGKDGAPHPEAVDPNLAALALLAAVRQAGADPRVFDAVLAAFGTSSDAPKRRSFLQALASTRDPALAARALDLALDPSLRKNERLVPLAPLLDDPATRDQAWTWLQAHFDALAPILPDRYAGFLPGAVHFCDEAKAGEVNAFFAPRVPGLTGGTRNLAQAVEAMTSCAKLAAEQRESAKAFVKRL